MTVTSPHAAVQPKRGANLLQRARAEGVSEERLGIEDIRDSRVTGWFEPSLQGLPLGYSAFAMRLCGLGAGGGFTNDELGCEPDGVGERLVGSLDALDEKLSGSASHLVQWLADGGKPRIGVLGDEDVVEADDGDVPGAGEAGVFNGPYGADRGGVVEAEDRGEVVGSEEEVPDRRVAKFGGP